MATTHRDAFKAACLILGAGGALLHGSAHAQTRTQSVTPTLAVKLEHTDNVDGVSDAPGQVRRAEDILTVNPSLLFQHKGATTTVEGRFGLLVEQRLRGTDSNRILPDGLVRWRTALPEQGVGLDASLLAQQVKPSISSVGQAAGSTSNAATETRAHVGPFLERRVSERETVIARINGDAQRTDPRDDQQRTTRTRAGSAQLAWLSRPAPFGYSLEANALNERTDNDTPAQSVSVPASSEQGQTRQAVVRATLLYNWYQELEVGLIAGTERDRRRVTLDTAGTRLESERNFDGPFGGFLATWRPTPRTTLSGRFESRESGRNWNTEFSHSLRRTTFALISSQTTARNAPTVVTGNSLTTGAVPGTGATPTPTPGTPFPGSTDASSPLTARNEIASAALTLQRNTALRVTYAGVRSTLNLTSGRFQSRALLTAPGVVAGTDRSRYNAAAVSYRLTPDVTPSAGLRWSRAQDALGVARREWLWTLGLGIRLSPWTVIESGFSMLRSTATSATSPDDARTVIHSANIRLEHRF